jgi:hypothetical protein
MGRGLSIIKRCSDFLTPHFKKQVLQDLVLSDLDYCSAMWSSAARKDLVKLQLAQNGAAHLALHCNQRANINTMHDSLPWLWVEERLTATLLFIRNIYVLKIPNGLHSQLTRSADTHTYFTRHATRGLFTIPRSRTNESEHIVLYTAMSAWNSLPSYIAQVNNTPGLKNTNIATPHGTAPLPHVTFFMCVYTDTYSRCNW